MMIQGCRKASRHKKIAYLKVLNLGVAVGGNCVMQSNEESDAV